MDRKNAGRDVHCLCAVRWTWRCRGYEMIDNIARAARDSGVCSTETDLEPESMFWPAAVMVLACAAFVGICFLGAAAHAGVI